MEEKTVSVPEFVLTITVRRDPVSGAYEYASHCNTSSGVAMGTCADPRLSAFERVQEWQQHTVHPKLAELAVVP